MEWFIKAFIRASLLWFTFGTIMGLAIALHPPWTAYRPAHAHANVVGFLTMLVFGVGYQLLPRLFGHPLHRPRLAVLHLVLANAGLALMVTGFIARVHDTWGQWVLGGGGVLFTLGVFLWLWNLWQTFDAADARARQRAASGAPQLPTLGS